ncbi:MAG TPA: branched-chain amino acid ABC transporter permease [Limnochordales bacterium]
MATVTLAALAVLGAFLTDWAAFVFTVALAKSLIVLGIILLMRAGLVSFGQGLYVAAAAYAAAFASRLWGITDAFALLLIGIVVSLVLAVMVGPIVSRYREIFFAMLTMAVSMVLYGFLLKAYSITGGTDGIGMREPTLLGAVVTGVAARRAYYYLSLLIAAAAVYAAHRLDHSPLGYMVRSIRDNDIRLEYIGISVRQVIFITYLLAAALAGCGGVLLAFALGHITPELANWTSSGEFVFVALFAGSGHVFAPVLGSITYQFLQTYAAKYWPYTWHIAMGAAMLLIILFMPEGLWGIVRRLTAWRARREGTVVAGGAATDGRVGDA